MFRRLAIAGAARAPAFVKRWVHSHRRAYAAARRLFALMLGQELVVIPEGPMLGIKLRPGVHVSHAHVRGTYERETQEAIGRAIRPGWVCYDVGASIGYLSLLMARTARLVYAFEPAPHAAAEIRRQLEVNGFDNIILVPDPVTDGVREVPFALTDVAFGSAINEAQCDWPVLKLRSTTLDLFAATHEPPEFIKLDVEGEEGRVLEGARKLLESKRPVICCEVHSREAAEHVAKVLGQNDYRIETLDGREFAPVGEIRGGEVQVMCWPK
jgi:FkbM family methyltransferase